MFEAFTDASAISNWWGPNGFRTTTASKDVRVGGAWVFTMHGPDGTDLPNHVLYTDVRGERPSLRINPSGHVSALGHPPTSRAAVQPDRRTEYGSWCVGGWPCGASAYAGGGERRLVG